jgi:hypothetical protein
MAEDEKHISVQYTTYVVDDRLDIVSGSSELPYSLVACGLIMQSGYDECPINRSAATCRILQYLFSLRKVNKCFVV